jgi:hypothetical protein
VAIAKFEEAAMIEAFNFNPYATEVVVERGWKP